MRTISSKNFIFSIFLIGLFFIPFNSWSGISFLGEFQRDSCFLFFSFASILLLFKKRISIPINNIIFQILILFILWAFISTILNSHNIINYNFKQTSGITRFLNQFGSLIIVSLIIPLTFFNVLKPYTIKSLFFKIRRVILWSLIVVSIYAFIEILIVKFNIINLKKPLLNLFDYFPFTEAKIDIRLRRISSVSFEPPALGTYLLSIAGWMLSYILTQKKIVKFIPAIIVLFLAFVSGSRAAFFIIIIQFSVAVALMFQKRKKTKNTKRSVIVFFITGMLILGYYNKQIYSYVKNEFQSFKIADPTHGLSNKSRFGIQYAMFKVFLNNPISGTGYGLQAFESWKKYPVWAKKGNWEFRLKYLNQNDKRFPPGYNLYLRILSETGIVGLLIFALLVTQIFIWCYNNLKSNNTHLSFIIFISMIGFCFNWIKADSLRIYFFCLCLALMWIIDEKKLKNEE